jgi:hypothetical protein
MEPIKKFSFEVIYKKLFGKNVRFKSDCELFQNFDVIIKVKNIYIKGHETIFEGLTKSNKKLTIGSNMKNLQFEII